MLSIIEFIVYGLICYSGIIFLIYSAFKDPSMSKSGGGSRVIWLIPSMFAAYILMSVGGGIIWDDGSTITTVNLNTTETWTETTTAATTSLVSPVWGTVHFMFFIIMLMYILFNIISLFVKRD